MHRVFTFLVLLLIISSTQAQSFQDTIPFRNDLGLIIIPITFNGVEKEFAFDTGAQQTLSYGWAKKNLKPTRKTTIIKSSTGAKTRMRYYKSGNIELGSRKVTGHRILNTPANEFFTCHKVDGILGVDIIKQLNWSIDYKHKILIMYPSNHFPEKVQKMSELDFNYKNNRPYVYLTRKENKFQFLLDTGAGGDSNISIKNYTLTNIDEFPQISSYSGSIDLSGTLTPSQEKTFKFPLAVSKDVSVSPIVDYNSEKSTKIGNRLWKGKELFLSLKSNQLFVSDSTIDQRFSRYPCAVMFRNNKMQITRIEVGSEPWKQGVRQGDQVMKVNGNIFTDFCSLDTYQRTYMSKSQPIKLEMAGGKKVILRRQEGF